MFVLINGTKPRENVIQLPEVWCTKDKATFNTTSLFFVLKQSGYEDALKNNWWSILSLSKEFSQVFYCAENKSYFTTCSWKSFVSRSKVTSLNGTTKKGERC